MNRIERLAEIAKSSALLFALIRVSVKGRPELKEQILEALRASNRDMGDPIAERANDMAIAWLSEL
jgi:hypothetical protein